MPDPSPGKQHLDLEEGSRPWRLPSPQPTSTIATIYPINSSVHPRVAILDYRATGWITHQVRVGPRGTTPGASLSGSSRMRQQPVRHGSGSAGSPDRPGTLSPVPLRRHGAVDLQFGQVHEEAAEIRCDGAVRPVRELGRQHGEADIVDARGAAGSQRYAVEPVPVVGAEGTRRRDREGDPVH